MSEIDECDDGDSEDSSRGEQTSSSDDDSGSSSCSSTDDDFIGDLASNPYSDTETTMNEDQLRLRQNAANLLHRLDVRKKKMEEEEKDWEAMNQDQLRRNARGLLRLLGEDVSMEDNIDGGAKNKRKTFPVPETPQWRFVAKAKKTEGYSSGSAGRAVYGRTSRELVSKYRVPTNAEINQNVEKEDDYYFGVGKIISNHRKKEDNVFEKTFELAFARRYQKHKATNRIGQEEEGQNNEQIDDFTRLEEGEMLLEDTVLRQVPSHSPVSFIGDIVAMDEPPTAADADKQTELVQEITVHEVDTQTGAEEPNEEHCKPTLVEESPKPRADEDESPTGNRKWYIFLTISLILLCSVASVLGVMLGGNESNGNDVASNLRGAGVMDGAEKNLPLAFASSPSPNISPQPSTQSSSGPSQTPTMSSQPTSSSMPSVEPTSTPSLSAQPSFMPSYCAEPEHDPKYAQALVEYWNTGNSFPNSPDESNAMLSHLLEIPKSFKARFSSRITAYITAPVTGAYTFWVAGDDRAELYLSTGTCHVDKRRIASVNAWAAPNDFVKYPSQKSEPINLVAGQSYYLEGHYMNAIRGGHFQAAWSFPSTPLLPAVIDGKYFSLYPPYPEETLNTITPPNHNPPRDVYYTSLSPPGRLKSTYHTTQNEDGGINTNSTIFY